MAKDSNAKDIMFPVGRFVFGNLYKGRDTDAEGKPLIVKSGPNAGQPRVDFPCGVAIPKGPEAVHGANGWMHTGWGGLILQVGAAAFPNGYQHPSFAWKVIDGDSTIPNKNTRKPCDQEGYKGCWILKFGGGYSPKKVSADGSQVLLEENAIVPGYYVQVYGSVSGNNSTQQSGVYLNHVVVALAAYGAPIVSGPDPTTLGFGQGQALPAGASLTPVGQMAVPAVTGAAVPQVAQVGIPQVGAVGIPQVANALPALPGVAVGVPQVAAVGIPQVTAVMPHPGVVGVPQVAVAIPQVIATPQYRMTPKAGGATREQLLAQPGVTDEILLAQGFMTL